MSNYKIHTNLKYSADNPISNFLVNNFTSQINEIIKRIDYDVVLDVGCGEGIIFAKLKQRFKDKKCTGVDIDKDHIEKANLNAPFASYQKGSIYDLRFPKNSFDLVMCLEVLEHLENPEKAVQNLKEVSSKYVLISVPREPIWRILNMVRGSYWRDWGNTPGHLNNWSTKQIKKMLGNHFEILEVRKPLPWTIILCKVRDFQER